MRKDQKLGRDKEERRLSSIFDEDNENEMDIDDDDEDLDKLSPSGRPIRNLAAAAKKKKKNDNDNNNRQKKKNRVNNNKIVPITREEGKKDAKIPSDLTIKEMEDKVAFCCYNCFCSDEHKSFVEGLDTDPFIQQSEDSLYHRRCCHSDRLLDSETDFLTQYEVVYQQVQNLQNEMWEKEDTNETKKQEAEEEEETFDKELFKKHCIQAMRDDSKMANETWLAEQTSILNTDPFYIEHKKSIEDHVNGRDVHSANVVDLFGGIGTGIVALKKLGISMNKVFHVEHDPVATHVFKYNHDPNYNKDLPDDGIKYYYFSSFEEFVDSGDQVFDILYEEDTDCFESDGIDIVLGGPPCNDFSPVNATRRGVEGEYGKYLAMMGYLITGEHELQESQGPGQKIFFLAENSILRNDKNVPMEEGDRDRVLHAFGENKAWAVELDAKEFSPGNRNRSYITNIPLELTKSDYANNVCVSNFTEGGYKHAANFIYPNVTVKANCFMASKGRLDDKRMYLFKEKENKTKDYLQRTYNISEREIIMGLPKGYVETPINELFSSLLHEGYGRKNLSNDESYWRNKLDEKYHLFGGRDVCFEVEYEDGMPIVSLTMAIPQTGQTPVFLNKDQYAKRLIGNAFSVPTVCTLMKKLASRTSIDEKKPYFEHRTYSNFDKTFAWNEN